MLKFRMNLVKIPYAVVDHSINADDDHFNTGFHSLTEAPHLEPPIDGPTDFVHWLPIIAHTQSIPLSSIPIIRLSRRQGALLLDASKSSLLTREPNRLLQEEIEDEVVPTFEFLTYPPGGYFLRLDGCSPKDGVNGIKPIRCVADIILRLVTSYRATNAIARILEQKPAEHRELMSEKQDAEADVNDATPIRLYFLPHNPRMSTAREYRVFCPPPTCQISAISQYKWHSTSMFADRPDIEIREIMDRILEGALKIRDTILETSPQKQNMILMRSQGFTFDVMYDEDTKDCCLIELNSFGTRSGCGSCLFQWLRDEPVLYGRGNALGDKVVGEMEVEFRISV